jgi:hypothetical protein
MGSLRYHELFMAGQKRVFALDVPGIHVLSAVAKFVDGRDKPSHDGGSERARKPSYFPCRSTLSFSA